MKRILTLSQCSFFSRAVDTWRTSPASLNRLLAAGSAAARTTPRKTGALNRKIAVMVGFIVTGMIRAIGLAAPPSAAEPRWSQTINGLQARIALRRTEACNGTPIISTYLVLRNVSRLDGPMRLIWDSEKIRDSVADADGRPLRRPASIVYSGLAFRKTGLEVPSHESRSFDISFHGMGVPGDKVGLIDLGPSHCWEFDKDDTVYFLHVALEFPEPKHAENGVGWDWYGKIDIPSVPIPLRPERSEPATLGEQIRRLGRTMLTAHGPAAREAAKALSLIDDERVVPWYAKVMDGNTYDAYELKLTALDRLRRFPGDAALEGLKKGTKTDRRGESDPNVRLSAAIALSRSPHPQARNLLLSMWEDPFSSVRVTVVQAIGEKDSEGSLALLRKMSKDPDECVRNEALRYLKLRTEKRAAGAAAGSSSGVPQNRMAPARTEPNCQRSNVPNLPEQALPGEPAALPARGVSVGRDTGTARVFAVAPIGGDLSRSRSSLRPPRVGDGH